MTMLAARCLRALLLAAMALMPLASFAHEARPAYLEIKETAPGQFSVLWRTPVLAGMRLPLVLQMPDGVTNVKPPGSANAFRSRTLITLKEYRNCGC